MERLIRPRPVAAPVAKAPNGRSPNTPSEEVHVLTFEWPTRSGTQSVVYLDRRRLH